MSKNRTAGLAIVAFGLVALIGFVGAALSQPESTRTERGRTTQSFDLEGFDRVHIGGGWEVAIVRSDGYRVAVSYPQEVGEDIEVSVDGDTLTIELDADGWPFGRRAPELDAEIAMPALSEVRLSGATNLDLEGFAGERLDVAASGAAEIDGRDSRYDRLDLTVSGAANVDFRELVATDASVNLSGAADVRIGMAGGTLSGRISGAGSIEYYGEVSREDVSVSGAGSIERAD